MITTTLFQVNSVWYINIYDSAKKKRTKKSLGTTDQAVAEKKLQEFRETILPEFEAQTTNNPSIRDLVAWYLETHLRLVQIAPKTRQKYTQVLTDFQNWLRTVNIGRIQQLSFRKLQEFTIWYADYYGRQDSAHAPRTIARNLGIIRSMINAAVKADLLETSPIKYWAIPKGPRQGRTMALTAMELHEVLDILEERSPAIWNICRFMANTGFRESDAIDLRWGQVDFPARLIIRQQIKTKERLVCPITDSIQEILDWEKNRGSSNSPEDHVFLNLSGWAFSDGAIYKTLTRTLTSANFPKPVSCHTFRHTFATLAANGDPKQGISSMPPRILQTLLGHRNIETTLKYYTEVSNEALRDWAEQITSRINPSSKTTPEEKIRFITPGA